MTRTRNATVASPQLISLGAAQPKPCFEIFTRTIEVHQHSVYLTEEIEGPADYVDLVHELRSAAPHDSFTLYLNTSGGRVDAGLQLINAIRDSEATVTAILDPYAYSMGAFIFLAADIQMVPDNAQLMLHNYSSGLLGKGNEQLAEVRAASQSFENLFKSICYPFLLPEEISNIMNGQDLWLDAENIRTRFDRIAKAEEKGSAEPEAPVPVARPRARRKTAPATTPSKR